MVRLRGQMKNSGYMRNSGLRDIPVFKRMLGKGPFQNYLAHSRTFYSMA